ncbi:HPr family phosphocarrier protein [Clostridium sp. AF19-22AC]|jgi:phosphocarrier protein HPr|uniref:PTS HPr component family protein n=1 Tax=Faecalicatena orotica TaxID=1544 RepID=A0A2Y9B8I0_9FIRM|nr:MULTISPECIES: HPr family phosphocarrier protein [Clostridia]PWJ32322.1 PTS HPr component family protein [Faecalicatena orotica]RHR25680.1 HPr family phosphocarrier protein [Clostridium sp. AF19-22AC]SSA54156.1 PTS HPr component phosphorylation site [Faecalicatena orotica]
MTTRNIQFSNMEEVMDFCSVCKNIKADIDVRHKNKWIDAKSLLGLMSLDLGEKLELVVYGEETENVDKYFSGYYS